MSNSQSINPWPGLGSYDESGKYEFCGRGKAANELYSLISNNAVVSLLGRSGIGKTSLLKAGVTPLLIRKGFLPVYVRLSQEEKVPDNGCTVSYAECIVRCLEKKMVENRFIKSETSCEIVTSEETDLSKKTDFLWSYFCKTAFQSSDDAHCTPVIILDQFEEIFQDRREDAAMLMRQLYVLVNGSRRLPGDLDYDAFRNRFRFVMSFRDDSLYLLEDVINEYNLASFKENRYLLKALDKESAKEVITKPGEGLVEDNVANKIVQKVIDMGDRKYADPAVLSLLMYGLYERMKQKGDTLIQGVLVDEAGKDIVRDFYERRMSGIGLSARKYLEENLVSSDGRRRSVAAADMCSHVKTEELESLTDKHILTKLERGRYSDYELTHDVLCPIVAASRAATDAKEKIARNKRMARILSAIVVVVLAIVAVFFFQNKHLKEERWKALGNQSRYIAEKALQLAEEGDVYLAKLLLLNTIPKDLEHPERPLTPESVSALAKIFDEEQGIIICHKSFGSSASYSPDGKIIVNGSEVWDASTGKCLLANCLKYSPDGKTIVIKSGKEAIIWNATTGKRSPLKHEGKVYSAEFSPDGKTIVTRSGKEAIIWNATTGKQIGSPLKHKEGELYSAEFSPDGKTIVTRSGKEAIIWNATTGKQIGSPLKHKEGEFYSAEFSPDGKTIVTRSGKEAIIWNATTGKKIGSPLKHKGRVYSAEFSPDGKTIFTVSSDSTAIIWNATTGKKIGSPLKHKGRFNSAKLSPDGKTIFTVSSDSTARLWNATTGKQIGSPLKQDVHSSVFSPDGKTIVTASWDSTAIIWNATTGKQIGSPLKHKEGHVNSASYSPDGKTIVTISGKEAMIWNATTGECLKILDGHKGGCKSAVFSPNGKNVVTVSYDNTIRIWNNVLVPSEEMWKNLPFWTAQVCSLPQSPNSKIAVTADNSCCLSLDVSTGKYLNTLSDLGSPDQKVARTFSGDGKITYRSESGECISYNIYDETFRSESGECIHNLSVFTPWLTGKTYSTNGKTILVPINRMVVICDASMSKIENLPVSTYHESDVSSAAYSPDGKTIVTASYDSKVIIWNAATRKAIHHLRGDNGHKGIVYSAEYSNNGKTIVTTSSDNTIKLWTSTGKFLRNLTRYNALTASFSPDDKNIITTSSDDEIRIWDVSSGACLKRMNDIPKPTYVRVVSASYSPDGKSIVVILSDSTAMMCTALPSFQEMLEITRERFKNRKLTREEKRRFYLE